MTMTAMPRPQPSEAVTTASAEPDGPAISRQRLGAALRDMRLRHGILLTDAAAELGVAASTLSRIENGIAPTRTS
jgi:predicted transcriptional regulator